IRDNEETIQMELETSENLEQDLNARIEELQKTLDEEKQAESLQLKKSEEVHLALAALEQQNVFILENISCIDEETGKLEAEIRELNSNKDHASEEIRKKEEKIRELKRTIEDSKELFDEIGKEIREQTEKREGLNQKHKEF